MTYSSIGLTRNPFAAERSAGVEPELFLRSDAPVPTPDAGVFVQVLGVRGAGKTSLLLHWRAHTGGPYAHVEVGWRRWHPLPGGRIVYWDEADRAPALMLRRALASAARRQSTVVAGTHHSLSTAASTAGLAVRTVQPITPTPEAIVRWAQLRIAASEQTNSVSTLELPPERAEAISRHCRGSWRVVGDRLHSWVAQQARTSSLS